MTHGDYALGTDADFLAVVEHRLVRVGLGVRRRGRRELVCGLFGLLLLENLVMLDMLGLEL